MSFDSTMLSCFSAKKPCCGEYSVFNFPGKSPLITIRAWESCVSTDAGLHKSPRRFCPIHLGGREANCSSPVSTFGMGLCYHKLSRSKRKNRATSLKSLTLDEIIPTSTYYFWHLCRCPPSALYYFRVLLKTSGVSIASMKHDGD